MSSDELETGAIAFVSDLSEFLTNQGQKTALIGAIALAVHGYVRGTEDWDCGVSTSNPQRLFKAIEEWLPADLSIEYRLPEAGDPLGGIASINGPGIPEIEIVNFTNPHALRNSPGPQAVKDAEYNENLGLAVVTPEHLFLLKLYAGSLRDLGDAAELVRNLSDREFDWALVTRLSEEHHLAGALAKVRAELEVDEQ